MSRATFESLGDIIRRMAPDRIVRPETSLLDLQALPPTADVVAAHDEAQIRLSTVSSGGRSDRIARRTLDLCARRVEDAMRRDAIQATRPAGCWCLGYGGSQPRYLPMPTGRLYQGHDGEDRPETAEQELLTVYCPCPDGAARQVADAAIRAAYATERDRRAVVRRFGEAQLPLEYRQYPWRDHPDRPVIRQVLRWMADPKDKPDSHHWLLISGENGTGKTTIAGGMAAEWTEAGEAVLFRTAPELLADIRATFGKVDEQEALRQTLRRVRYLILDDLATEVPKDWVGEFLYEVLTHRHNHHLPTVITTNLDQAEMAEYFGPRIWGRIKRMAEPVEMTGDDLRDIPHTR